MPYVLQRIAAACALILMSPVIAVVALAVAIDDGRPVLYRGTRIGLNGDEFTQLKFRSMLKNADALLTDVQSDVQVNRITRVGAVIRRLSLDELPQLVNVASGDMALIGPRPMLPDLLARVPATHPRFSVLPGITGLAQVAGRNDVKWSKRLILDAEYASDRSFAMDVRILLETVAVVAGRKGIAADRNPSEVLDI